MLAAVGFGAKMLSRIARLERLVAHAGGALASRALAAGYADQAHMSYEVLRLTGTNPVRFLRDKALGAAHGTAGLSTVKPPTAGACSSP
jgi:hypothetical protein